MQPRIIFLGQIEGVKESDVCVLGKIGTEENVLVFYHGKLLLKSSLD